MPKQVLAALAPGANSGHAQLPHGPRLANQWQQSGVSDGNACGLFAIRKAAGCWAIYRRRCKYRPFPRPLQWIVRQHSLTRWLRIRFRPNLTRAKTTTCAKVITKSSVRRRRHQARIGTIMMRLGLGKAKPAEAVIAASGAASGTLSAGSSISSGDRRHSLNLLAPAPRWTINSAGNLQRSFDQGSTWQDVNVNATPMPATSLEISAQTSQAKVKDRRREKTAEKSAPTFRAVAVTGTDVWAGGAAGALYHSPDAGNHWTHVIPTSAVAVLTGDIVSLEFSDALHGKVSTSTAEIWITSDDGQTWQKQ